MTTRDRQVPPAGARVYDGVWFRRWMDLRPCAACGHVRKVQISERVEFQGLPKEHRSWSWTTLCTACDLDAAARVHEEKAITMRKNAARIRARRKP